MAIYIRRNTAIAAIVLAGIYLLYPTCNPSNHLQKWSKHGNYVQYKDYDIFYHDSQGEFLNKDDAITLLIHGFPTSSYDWHKIKEGIRMDIGRVLAIDMLGFGFSDKPHDINYTVDLQADMIEHLLTTKFNVTRIHILAHDFGDTVALELLRRYNERQNNKINSKEHNTLTINSLTLLNGGLFPGLYRPRRIQHMLVNPYLKDILPYLINYYIFRNTFTKILGSKYEMSNQELMDTWHQVTYKSGKFNMGNILGYLKERVMHSDEWIGSMQKSTIPVQFIYGPADPINPPIVLEKFQELVPRVQSVVLDEVGHYPQLEDPYNVLQNYLRFRKSF